MAAKDVVAAVCRACGRELKRNRQDNDEAAFKRAKWGQQPQARERVMSDAPERIWADEGFGPYQKYGNFGEWFDSPKGETEYIRADIHKALEADNKRLRGYLERLTTAVEHRTHAPAEREQYYADLCQSLSVEVRAALTEGEA